MMQLEAIIESNDKLPLTIIILHPVHQTKPLCVPLFIKQKILSKAIPFNGNYSLIMEQDNLTKLVHSYK